MISAEDLVLSKIFSCDAHEAKLLLKVITSSIQSLQIPTARIDVVKQGLSDIILLSGRSESWWRLKLEIPESPSLSLRATASSSGSATHGGNDA